MRRWGKASAVLAMLGMAGLGMAGLARAQDASSAGSFQLPPNPAPNADRAGPVDAENPVVRPSTPSQSSPPATAAPTPTPAPSIAVPPPAPRAQATRPPRAERPAPASPAPVAVSPAPLATPALVPDEAAAPQPAPPPTLAPAPAEDAAAPEPANWLWAVLGAVAALLAGLGLWLRFGRRGTPHEAAEPPLAATPATPPASLPPVPAPAPAPVTDDDPAPLVRQGLEVTLEARELTGSLVYATLSYGLTLTNHGTAPTGPLAVAGDLVSAHAAIDSRTLLAPEAGTLAPLHEAPSLAPGESAELSGALRLPLSAILPLAGGAAFVPLARFHVRSSADDGLALAGIRVFVVGPAGAAPGDALRPFRFDRFPGVVRDLGQREIRAAL